jgi:hypothetical protein
LPFVCYLASKTLHRHLLHQTLTAMCYQNKTIMKCMATLVFIISVLLTTLTFGQSHSSVIATYKNNTITRPFFVRWLKELFAPPMGQLEKLQLKSDGMFYYSYHDSYCGFANHEASGTWIRTGNQLTLIPIGDSYVPGLR